MEHKTSVIWQSEIVWLIEIGRRTIGLAGAASDVMEALGVSSDIDFYPGNRVREFLWNYQGWPDNNRFGGVTHIRFQGVECFANDSEERSSLALGGGVKLH
jgi:hypothetical protein